MKTKVDSDVEGAWVVGLRAWILGLVRAEVEAAVAGATKPLEIFTTREAAQFARVSTVTVLRWVRDGRVLAFGVGRRARFKREDIERVLAEGIATSLRGGIVAISAGTSHDHSSTYEHAVRRRVA